MHDRRPMGAGSIEERRGRFRARLRVGGERRDLGTWPTRKEAAAVIAAALAELEEKRAGAASLTTLRDWVARWLPDREQSRAVRDSSNDSMRLSAYVLGESWADDPIETVSPKAIRTWMLALLRRPHKQTGEPLSRSTVVAVLSTLRVCFQGAVDAELIEQNPCDGLRVPKAPSSEDEPWTYLSLDEIDRLTSEPRIPERARLMYTVAIYTGLRKGELWGLRWRDVELEHVSPHVMVRRSRTGPTKTGKRRAVPLLPAALDAFRRLRETGGAADDLVFPTDGEMRGRTNHAGWRSRWKTYRCQDGSVTRSWVEGHRELAGIDRPVRFHDLRHTCASHLRMGSWTEKPMDLGDIQAWLGHSSAAMSLRYAHLAPDYLLGRAVPKPVPRSDRPRETIAVLDGRRRKRITPHPACGDAGLAAVGAAWGPLRRLAAEVARTIDDGRPVERAAAELANAVLDVTADAGAAAQKRGAR